LIFSRDGGSLNRLIRYRLESGATRSLVLRAGNRRAARSREAAGPGRDREGETIAKNIKAKVSELLADWLPSHGYELWDVEFVKSGAGRSLNVYVDKDGGMGTDDCEVVSRYLEGRLDEDGAIEGAYSLVVSSPGMDRPLLTDEHFARYRGAPVDVSLYKGVNGQKTYSGLLGERTADTLFLLSEEGTREVGLPRELVSKVKLQVIF
jgi:ribosome maturation factor RimP